MAQGIIETISDLLQSFVDDEPKLPMHVGEVMTCWMLVTMLDEGVTFEGLGANHAVDPELITLARRFAESGKRQSDRMKSFLLSEGVPLAETSSPKTSVSSPHDIPSGARFTDEEIANAISIKIVNVMTFTATAIAQSIRNNVAVLFIQSLQENLRDMVQLKKIMRKKQWIKVPPLYLPNGVPKG